MSHSVLDLNEPDHCLSCSADILILFTGYYIKRQFMFSGLIPYTVQNTPLDIVTSEFNAQSQTQLTLIKLNK